MAFVSGRSVEINVKRCKKERFDSQWSYFPFSVDS